MKDGMKLRVDGIVLATCEARVIVHHDPERWVRAIEFAMWAQRSSPWWVGDLLRHGFVRFGDDFAQYVPSDGFSSDQLDRMMGVSGSVPPQNRRPDLSWSHHCPVAALSRHEQREVLSMAVELGMTSFEVGRYVSDRKRRS